MLSSFSQFRPTSVAPVWTPGGRRVRYVALLPAAALAVLAYRARHADVGMANGQHPLRAQASTEPAEPDAGPELEAFSVEGYPSDAH